MAACYHMLVLRCAAAGMGRGTLAVLLTLARLAGAGAGAGLDRSVVQVFNMVQAEVSPQCRGWLLFLLCVQTGCGLLAMMSFNDYGHWCGPGNTGQPPVDSLDQCCEEHDGCYGLVMTAGECQVGPRWCQVVPGAAKEISR